MFEHYAALRDRVLDFAEKMEKEAQENGDNVLAHNLSGLRENVQNLRYSIAVIGFMKRGKSTLINTMLRRSNDDISPVRVQPCTAVLLHYRNPDQGEKPGSAEIFFENQKPKMVGLPQVRDYVDNERNPNNYKKVTHINICGDYPILNNAAVLSDTPGLGSIWREHNTTTEAFLPTADAIIILISADLPVEAAEKRFLEQLSKSEKDRVFVVLTKCDELPEREFSEVESWVHNQLEGAGIQYTRLYKTKAKSVFDALKRGASKEEIDNLLDSSGVKDLEEDLEKHVLDTSEKNTLLLRRLRTVMDCGQTYYKKQLAEVDANLRQFSRDYATLMSEQSTLTEEADELRKKRDIQLRTFEHEWDRHVRRFSNDLTGKEERIVDRITARLEKDGLLNAAMRRPLQLVAKAVEVEVKPLADDLATRLQDIIETLDRDLTNYLDLYTKRKRSTDKTATITGTGALALVAGGGAVAANSLSVTAAAINASWMTCASASTGLSTAAAQTGIIQGLWAWLFGSSATSQTLTVAGAASVKSSAFMTAAGTTVSGIMTAGFAMGAFWLTKEMVRMGLNRFHESRIPELTEKILGESADVIMTQLNKKRQEIVNDYTEIIEEEIQTTEKGLEEIINAIAQQDPVKKMELEARRNTLLERKRGTDKLQAELHALVPYTEI